MALDLSYTLCFWISAAVAIISTLLGGLYSGVYTDILQRVLMLISCVGSLYFQSVWLVVLRKHSHTKYQTVQRMPLEVVCVYNLHLYFSLQCICVPFVLINLYSLDIRQALINNTLCGLVHRS